METTTVRRLGRLRLDARSERLWLDGREIALRRKPFAVLRYLSERLGRVISRQELLASLWPRTHVTSTVLKVCVSEIREALGDDADALRFLETVPRVGYRWIGPTAEASGAASEPRSSTIVGREAELRRLDAWHDEASRGDRRIVFVTGGAGIGKTLLVDAFLDRFAARRFPRMARGQCIEHYGHGEAYLPILVLEAIADLCRGEEAERIVGALDRHAPTWLMQMPALLDGPRLVEWPHHRDAHRFRSTIPEFSFRFRIGVPPVHRFGTIASRGRAEPRRRRGGRAAHPSIGDRAATRHRIPEHRLRRALLDLEAAAIAGVCIAYAPLWATSD